MAMAERTIGVTQVPDGCVTTVFLGINKGHDQEAERLFETGVHGGHMSGFARQYATWSDARKGHDSVVEAAFNIDEESED